MPANPTSVQLKREHSIQVALLLDGLIWILYLGVAIVSGSLTMFAELVRGMLIIGTEIFALLIMRRIHRRQMNNLDFGSGKFEQVANILIAIGMLVGAIWVALRAFGMMIGDYPASSPTGFAAAAAISALNTYLNFVAWLAVLQATPPGSPVIMEAQLQSRTVKLISSSVVLVLLGFAALRFDPVIAAWCDALGGLLVAGYILSNALSMFRGGLPDLLDQAATEAIQRRINRVLARHYDDYSMLGRVRSRRSGKTVFIEIALGFSPELSVEDVDRRTHAIRTTIQLEITDSDVSILVSAA